MQCPATTRSCHRYRPATNTWPWPRKWLQQDRCESTTQRSAPMTRLSGDDPPHKTCLPLTAISQTDGRIPDSDRLSGRSTASLFAPEAECRSRYRDTDLGLIAYTCQEDGGRPGCRSGCAAEADRSRRRSASALTRYSTAISRKHAADTSSQGASVRPAHNMNRPTKPVQPLLR